MLHARYPATEKAGHYTFDRRTYIITVRITHALRPSPFPPLIYEPYMQPLCLSPICHRYLHISTFLILQRLPHCPESEEAMCIGITAMAFTLQINGHCDTRFAEAEAVATPGESAFAGPFHKRLRIAEAILGKACPLPKPHVPAPDVVGPALALYVAASHAILPDGLLMQAKFEKTRSDLFYYAIARMIPRTYADGPGRPLATGKFDFFPLSQAMYAAIIGPDDRIKHTVMVGHAEVSYQATVASKAATAQYKATKAKRTAAPTPQTLIAAAATTPSASTPPPPRTLNRMALLNVVSKKRYKTGEHAPCWQRYSTPFDATCTMS